MIRGASPRASPGRPRKTPLPRNRPAMALDLLTRLDPLRRLRCPFCFERFAACQMHFRCNDHYCKTDFARMIDDPILSRALNGPRWTAGMTTGSTLRSPWWVDPLHDERRGVRRNLDWMRPAGLAAMPELRQADRSSPLPALSRPSTRLRRDDGGRSHRGLRAAVGGEDDVRDGAAPRARPPRRSGARVHPRPADRRDPRAVRPRVSRADVRRDRVRHRRGPRVGRIPPEPLGLAEHRDQPGHPSASGLSHDPPRPSRISRHVALVLRHRGRRLGDEHRHAPWRGPVSQAGPRPPVPDRPVADSRGRPRPPAPPDGEGEPRPRRRLPRRRPQARDVLPEIAGRRSLWPSA